VADFVNEPHAGICTENKTADVINLVAAESSPARNTITAIVTQNRPEQIVEQLKKLKTLTLPKRHQIEVNDIHPDRLNAIFAHTYEQQPENFEKLLGLEGVGAKTLRSLSLISELVYGVPVSLRDPARYSFAHGGKDGIPFPVDRKTYDNSVQILHTALEHAKIGERDRIEALKKLKMWM
jgi:hypothetical protein